MNRNRQYELDREDLERMADMLEGKEQDKTELRSEFAKILRLMSEGMCWDDHIVTTGEYVEVVHG